MIDRRRLLFTAAAGAALAASGQTLAQEAAAPALTGEAGKLNTLMDRIFKEMLLESPETLTSLGFDKGENAAMKAKLDDRSQAKVDADKVKFRQAMTDLAAIDRETLPARSAVYYDTLKYFGDTVVSGYAFPYGGGLFPSAPWPRRRMRSSRSSFRVRPNSARGPLVTGIVAS